MSEVKHTPGPWKATPIAQGTKDYRIHAKGIPWQLAYLSENSQFEWPIEANARLIAAAPELLDALTDCLNALTADTIGRYDMDCPDWYRQVDAAVAKARAALAKAAGA